MEAPAKTKAPKAKAEPKPKKVSALDAAAKVLGEQGKPMNCQEMIEEMSRKKYWSSPNGATPGATLYAAIIREIKVKGKEAGSRRRNGASFPARPSSPRPTALHHRDPTRGLFSLAGGGRKFGKP